MYIFPHRVEWQSEFCSERNSILNVLETQIELHHIGSTAIEGLYAKDCIDILGVVEKFLEVASEVVNLEKIGYIHKGNYGISGREYFSKTKRKVHFHVFEIGNKNIAKHLKFIEVMRSSPDLVKKLNSLKLELHKLYPNNKNLYQQGKEAFYKDILK